ncbi:MAG: Ldh family oxidoreductase [Chloroflexi bacterium]|nr:Ldh family oxidoreductase [Chloroflexota bacterium]
MPRYAPDAIQELTRSIFASAGTPADIADFMAYSLVLADLSGHPSHGVIRIPSYLEMIEAGRIVPDGRPELLKESGTTALISGNKGFGHFTGKYATEVAIAKAKSAGVALVGLCEVNHLGRVGQWSEMAVAEGVLAIMAVGGGAGAGAGAPFGGAARALSTNPISAGVPNPAGPAIVMDFATTSTAEGKVRVARDKGAQLPPGQILDKDGNPSTNPADFYAGGMMVPAAAHKGYGLALLVEALGSAVTGTYASASGLLMGGSIIAVDPGALVGAETYGEGVRQLVARMHGTPPAGGFDQVLVPGEPESMNRANNRVAGIEIADATAANIRDAAAGLGVAAGPLA